MIGWAFIDFIIALGVATTLLSIYREWPVWLKTLVFISTMIAWPIPLAVVIGRHLIREK